ncbi:MAG: hypothetical protein ACOVOV_18635, partial [Dolichospermum sp.]
MGGGTSNTFSKFKKALILRLDCSRQSCVVMGLIPCESLIYDLINALGFALFNPNYKRRRTFSSL